MPAFTPHKTWLLGQLDGSLSGTPVDFDTGDLRCALISSTLAPLPGTHDIWSDLSANQVTGTNYTAGGYDFTAHDVTAVSDVIMMLDAEDATWLQHASGFSNARYAVLLAYNTGTPGNSVIVGSADLGGNKGNVAGPLTLQWHADGLIRWTAV